MAENIPGHNLLHLPGELQNKIISELDPFYQLVLRGTSRHFRQIIPVTMRHLVAAEASDEGMARDLYACSLCLCLRHSAEFADKMKTKSRRKLPGRIFDGGFTRFCVRCGLYPPPGNCGYGRGTLITKNKQTSVLCIRCVQLGEPAKDRLGHNAQFCICCWEVTREGREMRREEEAQLQREKEDRASRRAERRERWKERRMQLAASEESEFESDDSSNECTYDGKQQSTGLQVRSVRIKVPIYRGTR